MHGIWLYQKREPFVSHFIFECRLTFSAFRFLGWFRAESESSSFCRLAWRRGKSWSFRSRRPSGELKELRLRESDRMDQFNLKVYKIRKYFVIRYLYN
jgi:hypothetical protein